MSLQECRAQHEHDLEAQLHCCVLKTITPEQKAANKAVFDHLCALQEDLEAHGTLPFERDSAERTKKHKDKMNGLTYPENLFVKSHRSLKQLMPIPDVHKISDCDTIYRFLIARRFDQKLAIQDIIYFIAFREKYSLDTIVWDREVESMYNGLDGEELLQHTLADIEKKGKDSSSIKPSRPLLQPGWGSWNCGIDLTGHAVYYQKPNPKLLALLEKRWPYMDGMYDCRDPDFHSTTPPYCELLSRLYLRIMEKGRRLSRLLNFNDQHIIRNVLKITHTDYPDTDSFKETGGGLTCLIDVGAVKISHITSSKCKRAFSLFRVVSTMGQSYYPENMRRMIVINGGFIFGLIYKLVRPWLDPQTQKKIMLLSETNTHSIDDLSVQSSHVKSPTTASRDSSEEEDEREKEKRSKADYALLNALSKYIDPAFIPAWYGGSLPITQAPIFYGGGEPPKYLRENKFYEAAAAHLKAMVIPDLLPDPFVLESSTEGTPVSEAEWSAYCEHSSELFASTLSSANGSQVVH